MLHLLKTFIKALTHWLRGRIATYPKPAIRTASRVPGNLRYF